MTGIVCKVWNVSATKAKGSGRQIGDSIGYILDSEKTDLGLADETSEEFNSKQLGRECSYVENDVKTAKGAYVATQNLASDDVEGAVREMMEVKKFFGKLDGRAALHGIISLPESESSEGNVPKLLALCADVIGKVFPNNQAIFAVHANTDNLHAHFIVNSVGLDGRKIHQPKNFVRDVLQPCVNECAASRGFSMNEAWNARKETATEAVRLPVSVIKSRLRDAIDISIEKSEDFDGFLKQMRGMGYDARCGKHMSIIGDGMGKPMRSYQLGEAYSLDSIILRIQSKRLPFFKYHARLPYLLPDGKAEDPGDDLAFSPDVRPLKRYADMGEEERRRAVEMLRAGKNPWRMQKEMSWRLQAAADEVNMAYSAERYLEEFSSDGTFESALSAMLAEKKELASEKRSLKKSMEPHKAVVKIYERMRAIERKAYLYEHEGVTEYEGEHGEYLELTRRLRDGYGKSAKDVAELLESYDSQLKLINGRTSELSREYRELKKFASERGYPVGEGSLWDMIGCEKALADSRLGIFDSGVRYISSPDLPGRMIRVAKIPVAGADGRLAQGVEVSLMSSDGKVISSKDLSEGVSGLKEYVREIEGSHRLGRLESFQDASLAINYAGHAPTRPMGDKPRPENGVPMSFTTAINFLSKKKKVGVFTIANEELPGFYAVVNSGEREIRITAFGEDDNPLGEMVVPALQANGEGHFLELMDFAEKHGFGDRVLEFDSFEDYMSKLRQGAARRTER